MSNRYRSRTAPSGAQTKQAQQTKQSAKSPPLPKSPPPPPKQTPSARLRQEWHDLEVWLSVKREEKNKRVTERINEIISSKNRGRFHKAAPPPSSVDIVKFETELNKELAIQTRAEWVRRLDAVGLKEEEWTDITVEEMAAVAAAFEAPEPLGGNVSNDAAGIPTQEPSSGFAGSQQWSPLPTASWNTPPMTSASLRNGAQNGRMRPPQTAPDRTNTPILADSRTAARPAASGLPTPELLWEMHMPNKADTDTPAPPASRPTPPGMRRTGVRSAQVVTPLSKSTSSNPNGSTWRTPPTQPSVPSYSLQGSAAEESPWELLMRKNAVSEQPLTPPETPWAAHTANKPNPVSAQRTNATVADEFSNPWDIHMGSVSPTDESFSPIPSVDVTDRSPSPAYLYLSPVLVELEEERPSDLELLPEKTVETAIRQFHQMAAEADIELRRKLLKNKVDDAQHDELLEEHLRTMEERCRAVVDDWKKVRETEKQRRLAEEEKKQAEAEKQRKLAEANSKKKMTGKRGAKANTPAAKSPELQTKKGQMKAPAVNQASHKATVEEASDTEGSGSPVFARSGNADLLATNSEDIRSNTRPAKTATSNFFNEWGKSSGSRSSSPAPTKRSAEESKRPPVVTNNSFASQASFSPESTSSLWESTFSNATSNEEVHAQDTWNAAPVDEEEYESPSIWQTSANGASRAAANAWSFAANALSGERAATPARSAFGSYDFPSGGVNGSKTWKGEDTMYRSKSRGPFGDERLPSKDPRFTTWVPSPREDHEVNDPVKKMADLALQHLSEASSPEKEADHKDLYNAMPMFTKASSSKKQRAGARR